MVFYFSGTGNSLHVAKKIAEVQGENICSIAQEMAKGDETMLYELNDHEMLGFVYPVYAWAPPKMVVDFIRKMTIMGQSPYVYSVCTCGDEDGETTQILKVALRRKEMMLDGAFSIQMPNNYLFGFDVDSKEVEQKKLETAEITLKMINEVLKQRQSNVTLIHPGKFPKLKTSVINPLFNHFGLSTRKFYATDACTGCGLCEEICPVHTIKVDQKPSWEKNCTQCLGCINRCPVQAIQYGKGTLRKGRYCHPDLLS